MERAGAGRERRARGSVTLLPTPERRVQADVVATLEAVLERARAGEVTRVGIVFEHPGGTWNSTFSASEDRRIDAAMLIELGLRRLGFSVTRGA